MFSKKTGKAIIDMIIDPVDMQTFQHEGDMLLCVTAYHQFCKQNSRSYILMQMDQRGVLVNSKYQGSEISVQSISMYFLLVFTESLCKLIPSGGLFNILRVLTGVNRQ